MLGDYIPNELLKNNDTIIVEKGQTLAIFNFGKMKLKQQ